MTNFFHFFILIVLLLLPSCRTRYITAPKVRHRTDSIAVMSRDTVTKVAHQRDTIIVRDSVVMMVKGDSVIKEVWRYRDRVSIVRDTIRDGRTRAYTQVIRDSIQIPVAVETVKEVSRPLTWWQRTLQSLGWLALAAVAMLITWLVYRKK